MVSKEKSEEKEAPRPVKHPGAPGAEASAHGAAPAKIPAHVEAAVPTSVGAKTLEEAYKNFSAPNATMDNRQFAKMAKDVKLIDKKLDKTNVDLIFSKHAKARALTFEQFKAACADMAAKKKITPEAVESIIMKVGGPVYTGTKAEKVKLHDDKSTYTGVYAAGGPTNVDVGKGWPGWKG